MNKKAPSKQFQNEGLLRCLDEFKHEQEEVLST